MDDNSQERDRLMGGYSAEQMNGDEAILADQVTQAAYPSMV